MRELKKKSYWGSFSLLAFVVIVAIAYFLVYPSVGQLKDANIQVDAKNKDVVDLQNKITALQKLSTDMKNNPDKMKMLELGIPSDGAQAEIVATIANIASNTGTTVKSISQNTSAEPDLTQIIFSFETSYNGFKLMLGALENNIRFVDIKDINLTRNIKSEGGEAYIAGSMMLEMLQYSGEKASASTSQTSEVTNE